MMSMLHMGSFPSITNTYFLDSQVLDITKRAIQHLEFAMQTEFSYAKCLLQSGDFLCLHMV